MSAQLSRTIVYTILLCGYGASAFSTVPSRQLKRAVSMKEFRRLQRLELECASREIPSTDNTHASSSAHVSMDKNTSESLGLLARLKSLNPLHRRKRDSTHSGGGPDTASIAKLGMYALLSYGFVSNFSYVTTVICAWIIHGKASGLSPLAEGQWKQFFAIYTGLWAANNFLRPVRFSIAVFLAPTFDKMIAFLENKFGVSRSAATGLCVFLVNVCGTFSYLFGGLLIATKIAGVPLLP